MLPMQDPTRALAELDRAARLPGVARRLHGHQHRRPRAVRPGVLPRLRALPGARAARAAASARVIGAERLAPFYLGNLLGNPFDTAHRRRAPRLRRRARPAAEARGVPAPRGRRLAATCTGACSHGQRVRPETTGRAKKPVQRLPPPLHLRHHQPRRGRASLPRRHGRRGPRDARHRLLLRHGLRAAARRSSRPRRPGSPEGPGPSRPRKRRPLLRLG